MDAGSPRTAARPEGPDERSGPSARTLTLALVIALGLTTAGRWLFAAYGPLGLAGDEAHYWTWSQRLDWSYYSKGPLTAWLIAASTGLLGNTELGVRLPAGLLSVGLFVVLADLAIRLRTVLHGPMTAVQRARLRLLVLLGMAAHPMFAVSGLLMTIDAPFLLAWAAALWGIFRAEVEGWRWGWVVAGLAGGLGFLAKYTIGLLAGLLAVYWTVTWVLHRRMPASDPGDGAVRRSQGLCGFRAAVTDWRLWLGGALALACTLPVLVWNAGQEWVSFRHVGGQVSDERGWSLVGGLEPLVYQMVNPPLAVLLAGALVLLLRWSQQPGVSVAARRASVWMLASTLGTLLFFCVAGLQTKVQPNWPAPLWLSGVVLVFAVLPLVRSPGAGLAVEPDRVPRWVRWSAGRLLVPSIVLGLVMGVLGHVSTLFYRLGLDPQVDPARVLLGYDQLGSVVGEMRREFPEVQTVLSDDYDLASRVWFYTPDQPAVRLLRLDNRRSNQFDLWQDGQDPLPDGSDALLVVRAPAWLDAGPLSLRRLFTQIEPGSVRVVSLRVHGVAVSRVPYYVAIARGFRASDYRELQARLHAQRF